LYSLPMKRAILRPLLEKFSDPNQLPTKDQVVDLARRLADALDYDGDIDDLAEEALAIITTTMGEGVSLVDQDSHHDEQWVQKRGVAWTYLDAYEQHLLDLGWGRQVVHAIRASSTKILGHLQDPTCDGSWDRRGLVIGHVQSGKTASYLGLVAAAADAGYKFIVVIAGVHNALRRQTQERVDVGFVGRSSDPIRRVPIGVGQMPNYPHPVTLTTIYQDFSNTTASGSGWKINDFDKPIVLVIKKHVGVLESLYRWLGDMNAKGGKISDVPMLLIDDEADNASINTSRDEIDPTRTNRHIREILSLFAKSVYVGYTATPFANIFIDPDATYGEAQRELFPKDFIYSLEEPSNYFGPERVFLDDKSSDQILVAIDDAEVFLPLKHKQDHKVQALPPSLYRAIKQFVLIRAIRNLRGQADKHCSMMINVSRFVSVQKTVRDLVSLYVRDLQVEVKATYLIEGSDGVPMSSMAELREEFEYSFEDSGEKWETVKAALWEAVSAIDVVAINSKSDQALDYQASERSGVARTVIAVGGLSLSRGLTIEGLSVSYVYRNTRMYDTLMQMGRWFGYRFGYEDLSRIHLSRDSIDWYSHIAEATEELRQQIHQMRRDGLSPREFGLYVRAHPDQLLITATNKMRAGERIMVRQNLSGKLVETYTLPVSQQISEENNRLITELWKDLEKGDLISTGKGWIANRVPVPVIEAFIRRFKTHSDMATRKEAAIEYLRAISKSFPYGDVLLVSIRDNGEDKSVYKLGTQIRLKFTELGDDAVRLGKNRVASRGDEKLGLSPSIDVSKYKSDVDFRTARMSPLLMIHQLSIGGSAELQCVPAFGISFPPGDYRTEIEVVANRVWLERMIGATVDDVALEDDDD